MLNISQVPGGQYRLRDDRICRTYFVGPKAEAEILLKKFSRASKPRYALRLTSNGTYVVYDISHGKKLTKEAVRYESASMKRAQRVLDAFLQGLI